MTTRHKNERNKNAVQDKYYTFRVTLWAMRGLMTIFLLFFIISCSNQNAEKQLPSVINTDTPMVHQPQDTDIATVLKPNAVITDRFLRLIKFIDSSGYSYDTTRFKTSYEYLHHDKLQITQVYDYILYDILFVQTPPYINLERLKQKHSKHWGQSNDTIVNNFINTGNKVEKIMRYFFIQKTPLFFSNIDEEKFFVDGMIEEWKFPDNNSAQQAGELLVNNKMLDFMGLVDGIYGTNGSVFVCSIGNYLYVFHSRSYLFMLIIRKQIFKKFVKDNKATIISIRS